MASSCLQQLGIPLPIIQAPMAGGITSPELVATVCNAGGLGSLGAAYMTPDAISDAINRIRELTSKPFLVNLFAPEPCVSVPQTAMCEILQAVCPDFASEVHPVEPPYCPDFETQLEVLLDERVPLVSFTFGIPAKHHLQNLRENDCFLIGTATSLQEAQAIYDAGFDAVVAQGIEAGGHRGTFPGSEQDDALPLMDLVKQILAQVDLPCMAAGGITQAQQVQALLDLGVTAAQVGTAFITTQESGANDTYKQALLAQTDDTTCLTKAFSGRQARSVENTFIRAMAPHRDAILPFPLQNKLTRPIRAKAGQQGNAEFMSLWAGQRVAQCTELSAEELVKQLSE